MKKTIVFVVVIVGLTACFIIGWKTSYFKTITLLLGGKEVDTSNFPNRWESGRLLDPLYAENPFIETESIANNETHTFKSYFVNIPPFGHYQTKWYQVSNEEWDKFAVNLVFNIEKEGMFTLVTGPFLSDNVLFNSSSADEAFQWAIDHMEDYYPGFDRTSQEEATEK